MASDIGIIGLAVMGQNLALNMESKGYTVSVYNRTTSRTEEFVDSRAEGKDIEPTYGIDDFVYSLKRPRKVMLMVKAGKPVDIVIDKVIPFLEEGDIIIDGGNSHFSDTERRVGRAEEEGLLYLGTGVSGGEYGALHGPSIMPGGHREAYDEAGEILESAAAQTEEGPTCAYLGPRSAGHYVKMVHNGIEYAVMQGIAETYHLLREKGGFPPAEIGELLQNWNGELGAYLIEITVDILSRRDDKSDGPLIDVILDKAKQKGTGKWSVQSALDLGVPVPTIGAAVDARLLSSLKEERVEMARVLGSEEEGSWDLEDGDLESVRNALYLTIVSSYAQGLKLLEAASGEKEYGLDLEEVAKIWKDGCIVRSHLLDPIREAYSGEEKPLNLLVSDPFRETVKERVSGLRYLLARGKGGGVPLPAMSGTLDYFDSYRRAELPANVIQAQRDYFGAHTYQRKDEEGQFHTAWQDIYSI